MSYYNHESAQQKIYREQMDNSLVTVVRGLTTATILAVKTGDVVAAAVLSTALQGVIKETIKVLGAKGWTTTNAVTTIDECYEQLRRTARKTMDENGDTAA